MELRLNSMLVALILAATCSVAVAYDPLDPNGNITIKWDVISWTPDGYVAMVTMNNYQMYRQIMAPGWTVGWSWAKKEVIWSIVGAQATEQGDCSKFKGGIPHCCKHTPAIVDLLPGVPYNQQIANCCKAGVVSAYGQDPAGALSAFQVSVGLAGTTNKTVKLPKNFTLMGPGPGYTCGPATIIPSTVYFTADHRRKTQALMTWTVTCTYSQQLASPYPSCCVSFSSFYNSTIVPCAKCACGCGHDGGGVHGRGHGHGHGHGGGHNDGGKSSCIMGDSKRALSAGVNTPRKDGAALLQCTPHMCPIRVHWHVKLNYKDYWRAKIAVTNFNYRMNYTQWTLVAQHPNLNNVTEAAARARGMQPTTREMQAMAAGAAQISLDDLRNGHAGAANAAATGGGGGVHNDFLDQMLSGLPPSAWPDLAAAAAKATEDGAQAEGLRQHQQFGGPYDESALLASLLRQHQIDGGGAAAAKQMVLQQLADLRQGHHMMLQGMGRSPAVGGGGGDGLLLPLTLGNGGSGGDVQALLKAAANSAGGEAGVYGGFAGSLQQQQHFQPHPQQTAPMPSQSFGGGGASGGAAQQQAGAAAGGSGAPAPPRQRVRARRGQATDPHSIAERLRRERIAERMKALQELVPNANKTDKASMLDEIIDYVKFLQLQVKVLSMSRLGGAAAVAPLVADMSSEGRGGAAGGDGPAAAAGSDSLTVTEQQVAKLMEEDMGSAMQYLQGKGLCLMPVSLASAISSATCHFRPPIAAAAGPIPAALGAATHHLNAAMRQLPGGMNATTRQLPGGMNAADGAVPASPSMSVLTAQSAMANGGATDGDGSQPKDAASVSKP